jgi:hypothetical protein
MSGGKHLQILLIGLLWQHCRRVSRRLSVSFIISAKVLSADNSPLDYSTDGPLPRYVECPHPRYSLPVVWRGTIRLRNAIWLVLQLHLFRSELTREYLATDWSSIPGNRFRTSSSRLLSATVQQVSSLRPSLADI